MARYLKQSTAVAIRVGPFLDDTDGKTAETGLTITQADVRLSKNHGAFAQKADTGSLTHEEAGWYQCPLDATDTDAIGPLLLAIHETGALPVWVEFHVLAANVYDSLFGAATDKLEVDITHVGGVTATAGGTVDANVIQVAGASGGVAGFERALRGIVLGTADTGATTTSIPTSSLTPAATATDQFKGRIVVFDRDTTTTALRGQATDVTASTAGGTLTVTALSTAPASGDTFTIQ